MSDKYKMTGTKLLWHLDRLNDWKNGKKIAPLHIELGLTTGCNLKCTFCYGQFIGQTPLEKKYDMSKETIIDLFHDAKQAGVKSITLIGEGENTISPYFYDAIDYAREINLDLAIATNGIAFKKEKLKDVLESFVWIRISLCGSTRESYKHIHGVDAFDKVIDNIKHMIAIKKKENIDATIGLQMVVTNDNMDEIIPLARLGKKLGVDYLVVKPCADTPDRTFSVPFEKFHELDTIFAKAEQYSTDTYSVIIKRKKFTSGDKHNFSVCYATQFAIAIDARGNVAPCGHLLGYRQKDFNMGNINTMKFKDIIESDRYWEVQRLVQTLDVDKECETNCMHYYMCSFLQQLHTPPNHINFP